MSLKICMFGNAAAYHRYVCGGCSVV